MFKIRKMFKWEGSHRLVTSYSKSCQRLHGHSYLCEIIVGAEELNRDGMVLDFGELKDNISFCFETLDHRTMLYEKDILCEHIPKEELLKVRWNPTAENMAKALYLQIKPYIMVKSNITYFSIRIHETATGWAEFSEK